MSDSNTIVPDFHNAGRRTVRRAGKWLLIAAPYSPLLLAALRALPGRKWSPSDRAWLVPASWPSVVGPLRALAQQFGFDLSDVEPVLSELAKLGEEKRQRRRERLLARGWPRVSFRPEAEDRALASFANRQRRDHFRLKRHSSSSDSSPPASIEDSAT